jgi:hydrogenase-4 component F
MILLISSIYASTTIFSITYIKYIEEPLFEKNFYYLLMNLFAFTMFFSVSVNDLGLIWVGIEATTVTSALLVATENNERSIEATWRYIIVVSAGLIISLLSNIFIYSATHSLMLSTLLFNNQIQVSRVLVLGGMMAVIGYGTKAGIFPMHTWLPDVHGSAPAPVSAIFSAVLLPVALYVVIRISIIIPQVKTLSLVLGFLTVITASILLPSQKHYKRLFAYSTMENMGMALIGLSLNKYAFIGTIILLISHAFAKSSAFYLTGNILSRYKTHSIEKVNNVSKNMPFTGYSLIFAALGVTGTPPFGTFIGEIMIIYGVFQSMPVIWGLILVAFLTISFISINYKVGKMVFEKSETKSMERKHIGRIVPIVNVSLAFLIIFLIPKIIELLSKGVIK